MVITKLYGSMVFDDKTMQEWLPKEIYREMKRCIANDLPLDLDTANVIANAMKEWAVDKGVTHFTHWFQPLTGITAEKHDSFITPAKGGGVLMEFSGKELIKGEPDASSFPSGGLRATFEARGYTAWDPTSPAFIKDGILCIPTAFCSYNGESLDKKTPLLRSMEVLNRECLRVLKLFGRKTERVSAMVGPEQEYFLVDTSVFEKRKDLFFTGRTLYGARPTKGQELNDHYFGAIKPRVVAYMKELDEELWKLGILAKTKHNEVAPGQHELAPIYTTVNVAVDQNQLTMETMKKVAAKHGMTCLLTEKPFEYLNGSGKHNNWSLSTNFGHNLFNPGKSPEDNAQFLLMLAAVIAAVDKHQDLLRISVAHASNDHRLGANEAPPAIISMYLGDELTGILQAIADGRTYSTRAKCDVKIGVHVLPTFAMDSADRNRTSPFAFTGNKFEFRMPGASQTIADVNTVLNTIMAEEFKLFADELEKSKDLSEGIAAIIKRVMQEHGKIIFNGNNYSKDWEHEAERRGLLNLKTTIDALEHLCDEKNVKLFKDMGVFTETELRSRQEIDVERYCKEVCLEATTMLDIATKDIIPAALTYKKDVATGAYNSISAGIAADVEVELANKIEALVKTALRSVDNLKSALEDAHKFGFGFECGKHCKNAVIPAMDDLRAICDEMELTVAKSYWPMPNYSDVLFSVH